MPETIQFTIGAEVNGTDGVCGEVSRVVVDPVARAVTHLVVEPAHRQGLGRLVPLDLVATSAEEVCLSCTVAEFEKLGAAEETQFLPGTAGYAGYGQGQVLNWPYYIWGDGLGGGMGMGVGNISGPVVFDTLPVGEVVVRRGEHVHATDGEIGKVQGLVIAAADHHMTHVLLQEGHLWGRKEVAIPIGAVSGVDDGIQLNLTKQQVHDLPAIDVRLPPE
ncbi:MAG: PRC-barrel domain-containing protein [Actinomycetota bacterium]|nr:PRC-barrel domain-containing protein [Actinomycetota bacterium]